MQRDDQPTMTTGLEGIAEKARSEPKLRFTSLAHHITASRVWENLCRIPKRSAPGVDGRTVTEAKEGFKGWIDASIRPSSGIQRAGRPASLDSEAREA